MAYPPGAVERAMKAHEVIMRALNGQLTWIQAAEILGRSPRSIRRLRWLLQHRGYDGLFDRCRRTPSPKRAPVAEVQRLLALYRERYQGFNVRHFGPCTPRWPAAGRIAGVRRRSAAPWRAWASNTSSATPPPRGGGASASTAPCRIAS